VGILLGLGDHTTAVLSLTRGIGVLIIMVMVCWLLLAVFRGRCTRSAAWGSRWAFTVLLFPVVQPWYVLWRSFSAGRLGDPYGIRWQPIVVTSRRHLRPHGER